jgi:virginiamycin B lyase
MKAATALLLMAPWISLAQQYAIGEYVPNPQNFPNAVAPGPGGAVWFIAIGVVGRVTPSGVITMFKVPGEPSGLTAGPDGAIWFTYASAEGAIGRITTSGAVTNYPLPNPASFPGSIAAGADGALWFTDGGTNMIGRITTAGVVTEYLIPMPDAIPVSITRGPDNAMWFVDGSADNDIGRISLAGVVTEFPLPAGSSYAGNITSGPDGALWFTTGQSVGRITTSGAITEFPVTAGSPRSITTGPDGALWFTLGGSLGRITTAGAVTTYPLPQPSGAIDITTGPDGELWFSGGTGYGGDYTPGLIGEFVFVTANLSVTPSSGYFDQSLEFTGSGFAPNESVQIYAQGVGGTVLATATADASGSFTVSAVAPASPDLFGVPRFFAGLGQSRAKLGAATFTMLPHLQVTPNAGAAGSTVSAVGYGFGSFEPVRIYWDNPRTYLGTVTADANGTFNGSAAFPFTVPSGAPPGADGVIGRGRYTTDTGTGPFTVE